MNNKKYPCIKINNNTLQTNIGAISGADIGAVNGADIGAISGANYISNCEVTYKNTIITDKKCINCRFCLKQFLYTKNLNKHIREERCKILKLQKQQKENIFINLLEEEKIVNQTKKELNDIPKNNSINNDDNNQMNFLVNQIKLLNDKLEEQQKESQKQKKETANKLKLMNEKYTELEKNNLELKKINEKLQNKMNKIVNKNKISNTQNITNNTIINNNGVKLTNFGSEDLDKISYNVFIDTIKTQGIGLYNKAIDGIHFNKDHPENQNIYISDFNRDKVMIYKDEKWFLDNWDNIFPMLLEKVIQFGYDKEQFLRDCNYKRDGKNFNKQMIKNAIRWYKLLNIDAPDVEYFELEEYDRPEIDKETYNDYLEMHKFRKKHPKKQTESLIKNKMKLNIYNKREIPINNYKEIEDNTKKILLIEQK